MCMWQSWIHSNVIWFLLSCTVPEAAYSAREGCTVESPGKYPLTVVRTAEEGFALCAILRDRSRTSFCSFLLDDVVGVGVFVLKRYIKTWIHARLFINTASRERESDIYSRMAYSICEFTQLHLKGEKAKREGTFRSMFSKTQTLIFFPLSMLSYVIDVWKMWFFSYMQKLDTYCTQLAY